MEDKKFLLLFITLLSCFSCFLIFANSNYYQKFINFHFIDDHDKNIYSIQEKEKKEKISYLTIFLLVLIFVLCCIAVKLIYRLCFKKSDAEVEKDILKYKADKIAQNEEFRQFLRKELKNVQAKGRKTLSIINIAHIKNDQNKRKNSFQGSSKINLNLNLEKIPEIKIEDKNESLNDQFSNSQQDIDNNFDNQQIISNVSKKIPKKEQKKVFNYSKYCSFDINRNLGFQLKEYNFILELYGVSQSQYDIFYNFFNEAYKDCDEVEKKIARKNKAEVQKILNESIYTKPIDKQTLIRKNENSADLLATEAKNLKGVVNEYAKDDVAYNIASTKSEWTKNIHNGNFLKRSMKMFSKWPPIMHKKIVSFIFQRTQTHDAPGNIEKFDHFCEEYKNILNIPKGQALSKSNCKDFLFIEKIYLGARMALYELAHFHNLSLIVLGKKDLKKENIFSNDISIRDHYRWFGEEINKLYEKVFKIRRKIIKRIKDKKIFLDDEQ